MQNSITSNGSASWAAHTDDGVQSRNLAAIALAEAMHRARTQFHAEAQIAAEPVVVTLSPKQSLDVLRKKLKPLYSAIPQDVEGMDLGVVREEKPRLFLDMIAFVDIADDHKSYRLVQGGRNGPQVLLETADQTSLIARITDYIAQRLIMRERILEQGDPVVAGAAHFTRGISAGLAQHHVTSEPFLVPPKAQPVEAQKIEAVIKPVLDPTPVQRAVDQSVTSEPVQQAQETVSHQSTVVGDPRKAFAQATRAAQPKAKNWSQPSAEKANNFASNLAEKTNIVNGWWLWPTLAVLLGMGLAAYLLYLYSMSFAA